MKVAFQLAGKFAKWISFAIALLALFVIGCWRLIPDEDLRPEAQKLLERKIELPLEQNLVFALWGFEANPEQDSYATGREIVSAIAKVEAQPNINVELDDYKPMLGRKPLRFETVPRRYCAETAKSCLAAFREADAELQKEAIEYSAYLDRYHRLRNYPQLVEAVPKSLKVPFLRWSGLLHISELVDAQIVRDASRSQARAHAVSELAAEIVLWKRIATQADLLITKMVGATVLQRKFRLASELLSQYPEIAAKNEAMLAAITAPLSLADISMRRVLEGEFVFSASYIRSGDKNLIETEIKEGNDWAGKAIFALGAFKRNATINRYYANLHDAGEFYSQSSNLVVENEASFRAKNEQFDPFSPSAIFYNPIGKVLASVGNTNWGDYAFRMHDLAGYSRLLDLQRGAAVQRISREQIPAFLAAAGKDLADPYTGQPMQWDAVTGKLSFAARSEKLRKAGGLAVTLY